MYVCFSRLLQLLCRLWSPAAPWGWHVGHCDTRLHVVLNKALGHCPELGLQSVLHSRYFGMKLSRPSAECETPQTCIPAFRIYIQHYIIIYKKPFSNSCHLLSALNILLSWKIPVCFPSNYSKQCGTVPAGGLTQMHLLPRQKNGWLYFFLGM